MSAVVYRLELLPTEFGAPFYKDIDRTDDNAGFDMYCVKGYDAHELWRSEKACLLDLGASARMVRVHADGSEEDVHYWLCPRSSIIKTGLMMANSQGVIDKTYRGTLMGPVYNVNSTLFNKNQLGPEGSAGLPGKMIFKGERLFQICAPDMGWIKQVRVVSSLSSTERGEGGFGSSGK